MDIRILTQNDFERARDLWALSFADTPAFIDWFFFNRFNPGRALGLFEGNRLSAVVHMCPYSISVRGKTTKAPMIVGAATHPDARRRGLMAVLLRESYKFMAKEAPVSILYPFDFEFYRKAGYHIVSHRLLCTFHVDKLSHLPFAEPQACFERDIHALSERFFSRFRSHPVRSEQWMRWRMDEHALDGGKAVMVGDAYAMYSILDGTLFASEMAYSSMDSLMMLLGSLSRVKGVKAVRCSLPVADSPCDYFPDTRGMIMFEPFLMLRAFDINWLEGMRTDHDFDLSVRLDDPDGFVDGVWRIRSSGGLIELAEPSSAHEDKTLTLREFVQSVVSSDSYFVDMY